MNKSKCQEKDRLCQTTIICESRESCGKTLQAVKGGEVGFVGVSRAPITTPYLHSLGSRNSRLTNFDSANAAGLPPNRGVRKYLECIPRMNGDFMFVRSSASMWYSLRLAAYLRGDADSR